jgi:hypothetical protein
VVAGVRRHPAWLVWALLLAQLLLIEIFDAANDIIRGDLMPPAPRDAVANALRIVNFESVHGFFVEPDLYRYGQHGHTFMGVHLSSAVIVGLANNIYAFFHIGVPVIVAAWVYFRRRDHFGLLRNVLIVAGLVTLVGYFAFPVAPPRLTTGLTFHGHLLAFHDTMPYPKNAVLLNGRPLGYNPYAAMPSLHIAWATIVAGTVVLLARNPIVRALALFYPAVMTLAIVMTANHYIMDALGGVLTALLSLPVAYAMTRVLARPTARSEVAKS